eukprot:284408-Prymnesium_polylepis.1
MPMREVASRSWYRWPGHRAFGSSLPTPTSTTLPQSVRIQSRRASLQGHPRALWWGGRRREVGCTGRAPHQGRGLAGRTRVFPTRGDHPPNNAARGGPSGMMAHRGHGSLSISAS